MPHRRDQWYYGKVGGRFPTIQSCTDGGDIAQPLVERAPHNPAGSDGAAPGFSGDHVERDWEKEIARADGQASQHDNLGIQEIDTLGLW